MRYGANLNFRPNIFTEAVKSGQSNHFHSTHFSDSNRIHRTSSHLTLGLRYHTPKSPLIRSFCESRREFFLFKFQ